MSRALKLPLKFRLDLDVQVTLFSLASISAVIMASKRPHPEAGNEYADSKRPRSSNASPAQAPAKPGPAIPANIQEQIAAAKARAAAAREKLVGTNAPSPNPAPISFTGQTSAVDTARAQIEAMRARVAAATSRAAAVSSQRTSSPMQAYKPPEHDASGLKARGGLGIGLHPSLIGDAGHDRKDKSKSAPGPKFGTTIGNRKPDQPSAPKSKKQLDLSVPTAEEIKSNPYFDASLGSGGILPRARTSRALLFNQKGKYIAQATALRRQAHLEDMKRRIAESARKAGIEEDRSEQVFLVKDVPDIEWWDEGLVDGTTYPDFEDDAMAAEAKLKIDTDDSVITRYIQHPVLLEPPQDQLPFEQKPMHLTKEEQKKTRRQTRMADLKEKQAKVRLGLEPPEAPKIKKSNLMRVLGEQAVKDPTAVEARVNREIAERKDKHDQENQSRALTKEQRAEKLRENMEKNAAKGMRVSVFRIDSLAYNKNRQKIHINAKQHADLTGVMITTPSVNMVVVEAGQKTTSNMQKLLLRRIDWTENQASTAIAREQTEDRKDKNATPHWLKPEDSTGHLKDLSENKCLLVWHGDEKARRFKNWLERDCESEGQVRSFLEKSQMESMWTKVKNYVE